MNKILNPKVAVVVTGHIRPRFPYNLKECLANIFWDGNYEYDLYGCVWNKLENGDTIGRGYYNSNHRFRRLKLLDIDEYNENKELFTCSYDRQHDIKDIVEMSKSEILTKFMNQSKKNERGTHCGFGPEAVEYWVNRIRDQYYMINQAYRTVQDPMQYDIIIRLRTDFRLFTYIQIEGEPGAIVMPKGYDCIQFGKPKAMRKFFNLYHHMGEYEQDLAILNRHGYDTFNAENMLRHYMRTFGEHLYGLYEIDELDWTEGKEFLLGR